MYLAVIVLTMGVLPVVSILIEALPFPGGAGLVALIGKWFVFWAVGVRLLLAGVRQIFDPAFTAQTIFKVTDKPAQKIVAELGFGNVAIGTLGVLAIFKSRWVMPAVAGLVFSGLAGVKHLLTSDRARLEDLALISDIWIAVVLAVCIVTTPVASR